MEIENLTIKQVRELQSLLGVQPKSSGLPIEVGNNYFIRTISMYYTGKVKSIKDDVLVLEKAAWIADTGRFYNFLKTGEVNEVEPFVDDVIIPISSICDITSWRHALFESQK